MSQITKLQTARRTPFLETVAVSSALASPDRESGGRGESALVKPSPEWITRRDAGLYAEGRSEGPADRRGRRRSCETMRCEPPERQFILPICLGDVTARVVALAR